MHQVSAWRGLVVFCLFMLFPRGTGAQNEPILRVEPGGHTARVMRVLFRNTPDRRELISIGDDKAIRIWDVRSGLQVRTLRAQTGPGAMGVLYAEALSSDGRTLAIAGFETIGQGSRIRLFDLESGKITQVLKGMNDTIGALAFSRDAQTLASASPLMPELMLWNVQTGDARPLKGHTAGIYQMAFAPDGQRIVSASKDRTARVWDVRSGRTLHTLPQDAPLRSVDWSPDGKWIAGGAEDGTIQVWEAETGRRVHTMAKQSNPVVSLQFSPDSRRLLTGLGIVSLQAAIARDFGVRVWSVEDAKLLKEFTQHDSTVPAVAFSPDGRQAASGDFRGQIFLWDTTTGQAARLAGTGAPVTTVAWAADNRKVAWGYMQDDTRNVQPKVSHAFGFDTGLPFVPKPEDYRQGAVLDQGERHLSLGEDRLSVVLTEGGKTTKIQLTKEEPEIRVGGSVFQARQLQDRVNEVRCFTFTKEGQVVVGSMFGLTLFDRSGKRLKEFVGHTSEVLAVAVSPDGKYLASASGDQTVRVWGMADPGRNVGGVKNAVEPLVSVFRGTDGQFVAWNDPTGYYTASARGDDLIGWQVNRGPQSASDFYTASQFQAQFYRPDVISRLLEKGNVHEALKIANDIRRTDPNPTRPKPPPVDPIPIREQVVKAPPPGAEIVGIDPGQKQDGLFLVRQAEITVRVRIRNAKPEDVDLDIFVNSGGSKRARQAPPAAAVDELLRQITLPKGQATLTVVARRKLTGEESSPVYVKVFYQPSDEQKPRTSYGNLHVLAIGISKFAGVRDLKFAAQDADRIATFYEKQQGTLSPRVIVHKVLNKEATGERIRQELQSLKEQVQRDDRILVFISSHGEPYDGRYYLVPTDYEGDDPRAKGISWSEIILSVSEIDCSNVLLIVDHCFSGGVNLELLKAADQLYCRGSNPQIEAQRDLRRHNILSFASSTSEQESWEDTDVKHGMFTFALLETLQGKGRWNAGTLVFDDAAKYVYDRVKDLAASKGKEQTPTWWFLNPDIGTQLIYSLPVARNRPSQPTENRP